MNKLLILDSKAADFADEIEKRALLDLEIHVYAEPIKSKAVVADVNIILGTPAMVLEVLSEAKGLQWVQSTFAGVERFCKPGIRKDYVLTGVKNIFGAQMSEYVFAYILALERSLFETFENQKKRKWRALPFRSIAGLTIGICGLGSIGQELARTAANFGMRIVALKSAYDDVDQVERIYEPTQMAEFVAQVDYLVNTLPDTPATHGMINGSILEKMKESAVLINVGRGSTIVEKDLTIALQNGVIRAAVIDVFEHEPLSESSPLWEMENVIVTPHNSAFSFPKDIADIFEENYHKFTRGETLNYIVDFEQGY